ncbi:MAG: helix-turn-helix domain-containing protein [Ruminococcus sp.]|nr:helix-turn-helix domain-containing protein [Ruminococcus sp.]
MNYDAFKSKCKEKGYSASSLVTELGISKSNITNWKNGGNPSYDILIKMAQTLECSVGYLLGTEDESNGAGATVSSALRTIKSTPARTISLRSSKSIDNKYLNEIAVYANCDILFLCSESEKKFNPTEPDRITVEISERGRDKLDTILDNVTNNPTIAIIQMQISRIILHNLGITSAEQIEDEFVRSRANYILTGKKSKDSLRNYPFNISDIHVLGDQFDKSKKFMISGIK